MEVYGRVGASIAYYRIRYTLADVLHASALFRGRKISISLNTAASADLVRRMSLKISHEYVDKRKLDSVNKIKV